MNKREVKRIFIDLLKAYRDNEECIIANMGSEDENENLKIEIRDYLNRMRKALNEGD